MAFLYKNLYNVGMGHRSADLSAVLSSQARFRVLHRLAALTVGLKLRELERACGLSIRSVQLATQALTHERVLRKTRDGYFVLNDKSPAAARLCGMFAYLHDEETRQKAQALSARAQAVVQLSDQVRRLVRMGGSLNGAR